MSRNEIIIIVTIVIVSILVVGLIILAIINFKINKDKKLVLKNSEKIQTLINLNNITCFETIQPCYSNYLECNSKRQLDKFFMDEYFIALIDEDENFYRDIIQKLNKNISTYNEYMNRVREIKSTATEDYCKQIKFNYTKFVKYENRIFISKILSEPQMDVTICCKASYTSPAGRNQYWKEHNFTFSDLKKYFDYTIRLKKQRQTRQYQIKQERAKMTESLRYDILKRDNFRCQICGSSAQDGVKLHVDHIVPVSKGGKTIRSNLRTLCDRCNMGKSDKM